MRHYTNPHLLLPLPYISAYCGNLWPWPCRWSSRLGLAGYALDFTLQITALTPYLVVFTVYILHSFLCLSLQQSFARLQKFCLSKYKIFWWDANVFDSCVGI